MKSAASDRRRKLRAADRIVQSGSVHIGSVGGEIVALDVASGSCFGLNEVGSAVWARITSATRIADVCISLCEIYEVGYDECEAQVIDLLGELRAEGLIEIL